MGSSCWGLGLGIMEAKGLGLGSRKLEPGGNGSGGEAILEPSGREWPGPWVSITWALHTTVRGTCTREGGWVEVPTSSTG